MYSLYVEILWASFSNYSPFFFFRSGKLGTFIRKIPKSSTRPGQHGAAPIKKPTPFSIRLREKQKFRAYYSISERQIVTYMKKARKVKGPTGQILVQLLEIRLDVVVYRTRWAETIPAARQIVNHGYIFVNSKQAISSNRTCYCNDGFSKQTGTPQFDTSIPNSFSNIGQTSRTHSYFDQLLVVEYYSNRLSLSFFIFMSRINLSSVFVPLVGLAFPRIATRAFFLFVERFLID